MSKIPRIAPPGTIFHVLNRGNAGRTIFDSDGDYWAFEQLLGEILGHVPIRILSYSLMPNHWHFTLWPSEDGELAAFMQRLTVTHVRRWHEYRQSTGTGHLYQGTYKSFPVQSDQHFLIVCRYVERNPLRAGLVQRAEHWRWGSLWHRQNRNPLAQKLSSEWPVERQSDYLDWVNEVQTQGELDALRTCIRRGCPFGEQGWQARMAKLLGLESTLRARGRPRKDH